MASCTAAHRFAPQQLAALSLVQALCTVLPLAWKTLARRQARPSGPAAPPGVVTPAPDRSTALSPSGEPHAIRRQGFEMMRGSTASEQVQGRLPMPPAAGDQSLDRFDKAGIDIIATVR